MQLSDLLLVSSFLVHYWYWQRQGTYKWCRWIGYIDVGDRFWRWWWQVWEVTFLRCWWRFLPWGPCNFRNWNVPIFKISKIWYYHRIQRYGLTRNKGLMIKFDPLKTLIFHVFLIWENRKLGSFRYLKLHSASNIHCPFLHKRWAQRFKRCH